MTREKLLPKEEWHEGGDGHGYVYQYIGPIHYLCECGAYFLNREGWLDHKGRAERDAPMTATHDLTMRREPLGAVPGFRAVCSCGESAWWLDEWQVDPWWERHRGAA